MEAFTCSDARSIGLRPRIPAGCPGITRAAAWPLRVRLVFTKVGLRVGRG